jgi:hypothetical protein
MNCHTSYIALRRHYYSAEPEAHGVTASSTSN